MESIESVILTPSITIYHSKVFCLQITQFDDFARLFIGVTFQEQPSAYRGEPSLAVPSELVDKTNSRI